MDTKEVKSLKFDGSRVDRHIRVKGGMLIETRIGIPTWIFYDNDNYPRMIMLKGDNQMSLYQPLFDDAFSFPFSTAEFTAEASEDDKEIIVNITANGKSKELLRFREDGTIELSRVLSYPSFRA